jgi:hypothetical protein
VLSLPGPGHENAVGACLALIGHDGFKLVDGGENLGGFGLAEAAFEFGQKPAATLGLLNRLQQILEIQALILDRHDANSTHTAPQIGAGLTCGDIRGKR